MLAHIARAIGVLCLVLAALMGCSSRAVFENAQHNKRNECQRLPPSQYDACMERASQTFDEYRKARDEVIDR